MQVELVNLRFDSYILNLIKSEFPETPPPTFSVAQKSSWSCEITRPLGREIRKQDQDQDVPLQD